MSKEVVQLKLSEKLDSDTKRKLNNMSKPKPKKKQNVEKLTEKDLLDLMGVNRQTYERRGGAVRRK